MALATPVGAQFPGLPVAKPEAAAAAETAEATEARLQQWLKEARVALARLSETGADKPQIPAGVESGALADHRRDLEQIVLAIGRQQQMLAAAPDARKALRAAVDVDAAWTGFPDKPPYSILMLDELLNQRDALEDKAASYRSSIALFSRTLSGLQDKGRAAEEISRRALAEIAEDSAVDGVAKWMLAADRTKLRLLALRASFLQANVVLLEDQAETARIQLALLERQISTAKKHLSFTEEDLVKVRKSSADRQAVLRKEAAAMRKRLESASAAQIHAQEARDALLEPAAEGATPEQGAELSLATVKAEATETRADSLQFVIRNLESLDQLESYWPDLYQKRRDLSTSKSEADRATLLMGLRSSHELLTAWEVVAANELASVNADIGRQESRTAGFAAEDPRLLPINDIRAALWDKQAVLQRVSQAVGWQRRVLSRWLVDLESANASMPLGRRFSEGTRAAWAGIKEVWNFEVFEYDDTVMMGGVPITEKRGVALGKFIIAISLFFLAYFVSRRINNRLRNVVVRRGHIAEAQAKTLGNWLMVVVGFLLAVATLHFLRIPLTVFAFFGGALAIGLGFGTQTLIKNFISGIIVLFERKIRVGDVVDVAGVTGTITEINTRSSVLRGADGKESLVPNSLFLEGKVTNLTFSNRRVRRMLSVRVRLDASPQAVSAIIASCAERHGVILKEPAPIVTFEDFAENAHIFAVYYWTEINDKTNAEVVASDLRFMIEKGFAETGIAFQGTPRQPPVPEKPNAEEE